MAFDSDVADEIITQTLMMVADDDKHWLFVNVPRLRCKAD